MEYRSLGRTGVQVSPLCLGCMTFGGKTDQEEATAIVGRFLDAGGNFIDTANVYTRGVSEEMTGKALAGGKRDQVVLATKVHGRLRLNRFVCEQPPYHILDRRIERELVPVAQTYGLGLIPWSPLAGGKLTGKYQRGQARPEGSREDPAQFSEGTWKALEGLSSLCQEKGCSMTAFALAWNMSQPGITSPIIGPNSVEQLEQNLEALQVQVTDEDRKRVDELVPPGTHVEDYYRADFGPHPHRW